jgi:hypothetical protein
VEKVSLCCSEFAFRSNRLEADWVNCRAIELSFSQIHHNLHVNYCFNTAGVCFVTKPFALMIFKIDLKEEELGN